MTNREFRASFDPLRANVQQPKAGTKPENLEQKAEGVPGMKRPEEQETNYLRWAVVFGIAAIGLGAYITTDALQGDAYRSQDTLKKVVPAVKKAEAEYKGR